MKFKALILGSLLSSPLLSPLPAWAHIQLVAPMPRVPNTDSIKSSPCGPMAKSQSRVTTFRPGETITVQWKETIVHPGYFRVLLDEQGQDDLSKPTMESFRMFHDHYNNRGVTAAQLPNVVEGPVKQGNVWVLADYWGRHSGTAQTPASVKVKLPNVTCTSCTLQLVQSMFESGRNYDNAYYYHCADLVITGEAVVPSDAGVSEPKDGGVAGAGGGGASGGSSGGTSGGSSAGSSAGSSGGTSGGSSGRGGAGGSSAMAPEEQDEDDEDGNQNEDGDDEDNEDKSSGGCSIAAKSTGLGAAWLMVSALVMLSRRRKGRSK